MADYKREQYLDYKYEFWKENNNIDGIVVSLLHEHMI